MRPHVATLFLAACLAPLPAAAQPQRIWFDAYRDGQPFGHHRIEIVPHGDEHRVRIDIELSVELAVLTLFRYTHHNQESWRGDELIAVQTITDDDGKSYFVQAERDRDGYTIHSSAGDYNAAAPLFPSSYWNPKILDQTRILNTQTGALIPIKVTKLGEEEIEAEGIRQSARRYHIEADTPIDIWYCVVDNSWCGLEFQVRGSKITYKRVSPPAQTATPAEEAPTDVSPADSPTE